MNGGGEPGCCVAPPRVPRARVGRSSRSSRSQDEFLSAVVRGVAPQQALSIERTVRQCPHRPAAGWGTDTQRGPAAAPLAVCHLCLGQLRVCVRARG